MKEKKTKNHKENWIGNIIRGFLLFMPLLAIGVTCAYAIFNKNAYQSYDNVINSVETKIIDGSTLYQGQLYQVSYNGKNENYNVTNQSIQIIENSSNIVEKVFNNANWIAKQINFAYEGNRQRIIVYDTNNIQHNKFDYFLNNPNETIYFKPSQDYTFLNYSNNYVNYFSITYDYGKVSNVFYYSIDKVQQSPLFNWATDTGMYNVIHGACTTIGIQSTFVPFLLAYWLLTYLIYIIYDIALLIVNMAHNKIHDVESSI